MIHKTFSFEMLKDIFDDSCLDYKAVEVVDIGYNEENNSMHELIFQSVLNPSETWSWQFNLHLDSLTIDSEINQETACLKVRSTTKTVQFWEPYEELE